MDAGSGLRIFFNKLSTIQTTGTFHHHRGDLFGFKTVGFTAVGFSRFPGYKKIDTASAVDSFHYAILL